MFALLRLGLGTSTDVQKENISDLFVASPKEWEWLEDTARFQGVSGVVLDGLKAVLDELGSGCFIRTVSAEWWKTFILQWIGSVMQVYEAGNAQQLKVIDDVQKRWGEAGLRMMLMKGQAMGTYYPEPLHRAPGDIDCYLINENQSQKDGYQLGNEVAKVWAEKVDEGWYKHSVISYKGQTIENHQFFVHTREGKTSKKLNELLEKVIDERLEVRELPGTGALLPSPMFNAIFLTYHAQAHFLEEGLKLKQLLDWAMFLRKDAEKVDWERFWKECERFHLKRFAQVTSYIADKYLGVNVKGERLEVNESEEITNLAVKVMKSTLEDKDYVFSSGEGGWKNRWHIVRNLFKYRWKYKEVYQRSVLWQLWWYAVGYVFKTE